MSKVLPMATEIFSAEAGEAEGCIQCQKGSKMVLFVTGKCHWGCDYCPLSDNRRESPDMFANERRCNSWDAVIEEARAMNATGTGITGGDPMLDAQRSIDAITILKQAFGMQHHIHLYTSIPFEQRIAQKLSDAGLDEIRFHLLDNRLERYLEIITFCHELGINVGIELPCEPDKEEVLSKLLHEIDGSPIQFVNLNELEITVGNQENMDIRGFNLSGSMTAAAEGSLELGLKLKNMAKDMSFHLKFCTANFKDAGQLRARFRRRAKVTLRPYEVLSDDDTILFGAIPTPVEEAMEDIAEIKAELGLTDGWIRYNASKQRIELPLSIAEDIAPELTVPIMMVEEHPTHERLEVSVINLNEIR